MKPEIIKLKEINEGILFHLKKICEITESTKDSKLSVYPKYLEKVKLYEWIVEAQKNT